MNFQVMERAMIMDQIIIIITIFIWKICVALIQQLIWNGITNIMRVNDSHSIHPVSVPIIQRIEPVFTQDAVHAMIGQ